MGEKHPLLEDARFEDALKTIPGFDDFKKEQGKDHYEITTGIQPADQIGLTVKQLQGKMRELVEGTPAKPVTAKDQRLAEAIKALHHRIQKEFSVSVQMGVEWEFKARPVEGKPGSYRMDERAYDGTGGTNSLHINLSLNDKDGTPVLLHIYQDGKTHIDPTGYNVALGLRDMLEATPLWSATDEESFKRFTLGHGAPKNYNVIAGKDGIAAIMVRTDRGLRGPDPGDTDRIYAYLENRIPAGDVDPQIAVFQSLLGVYHGLDRERALRKEADRMEGLDEAGFLSEIRKYGWQGTVAEYMKEWAEDKTYKDLLKAQAVELRESADRAASKESKYVGLGLRGTDTPRSLAEARERQQHNTLVDQYVESGVITADTVQLINGMMTDLRIARDGSSRAKAAND